MANKDAVDRALDEEYARGMMQEFGYAPNPHCKSCGGFGKVHPLRFDGRVDWVNVEMCRQAGCLYESYNKRQQR